MPLLRKRKSRNIGIRDEVEVNTIMQDLTDMKNMPMRRVPHTSVRYKSPVREMLKTQGRLRRHTSKPEQTKLLISENAEEK